MDEDDPLLRQPWEDADSAAASDVGPSRCRISFAVSVGPLPLQ